MEGAVEGRTGRTFAFARIEKCPSATENLHNFLLSTAPLESGREPARRGRGEREGKKRRVADPVSCLTLLWEGWVRLAQANLCGIFQLVSTFLDFIRAQRESAR